MLGVNVTGLFTLTRDLAPMLIASATPDWPSTVINMGSVMGTVTQSETAWAYSASKAAVHHLTRILAAEFAEKQVTVSAFAPGPFPTNMTKFAIGDEAGQARSAKSVPMGQVGRPEDIAGPLLFLTGRGGAYGRPQRPERGGAAGLGRAGPQPPRRMRDKQYHAVHFQSGVRGLTSSSGLEIRPRFDVHLKPALAEPTQAFKFTVCVLNKNEPTPTRLIPTTSQVDVPI